MFKHKFLGARDGNFNPNQPDFMGFLDAVDLNYLGGLEDPRKIISPACKFTNRIVKLGVEDKHHTNEILTTKSFADGVVIDQKDIAGVIYNADCPVVAVFEPQKQKFAVLHAGFRCLMPEKDSRGRRARSIIGVLFDDFNFDPSAVKIRVTKGIGPCCYGAEHWPEMNDTSVDIPVSRATRGPRAGKKSIDLYRMIYDQLVKRKVKPTDISMETQCTCCDGWFLSSNYHSHCRSGVKAGRNAIGFWMT